MWVKAGTVYRKDRELRVREGIDVVGLGINVQLVEELFPKSLMIDQLGQLKTSLFKLTQDWLTG